MEETYYYIGKEELLSLIEDSLTLTALESGGVDNWEWYGESIYEFCKNEKVKNIRELAEKDLFFSYKEAK